MALLSCRFWDNQRGQYRDLEIRSGVSQDHWK